MAEPADTLMLLAEHLLGRPREQLSALIPRLSTQAAENLGFLNKQLVLSKRAPAAQPSPCPQSPRSVVVRTSPCTRLSTSTQWWARFLTVVNVPLPADMTDLIATPATSWLSTSVTLLPPSLTSDHSNMSLYAARVAYMLKLDSFSALTTALSIAHCIFFLIAADPDPATWGARSGHKASLPRLSAQRLHKLYEEYGPLLAADPEITLNEQDFTKQMKAWRKKGSRYAFLARRLGLGALLHLQPLVSPDAMWGASVGESEGSARASESAFRHLERMGIVEEARSSGAEDWMHDCLWELCGQFEGFESRLPGAAFPGFQRRHEASQVQRNEDAEMTVGHIEAVQGNNTTESTAVNEAGSNARDVTLVVS